MRETLGLAGALLSSMHGHDSADTQSARLEALIVKDTPFATEMTAPLNVGVDNLYASHSSHSSHSSHASHASHYSGSGGSSYPAPTRYVPPPPLRPPPAPQSLQPLAPSTYVPNEAPRSIAPSRTYLPSSNRPATESGTAQPDALQLLIMRVQVALYAAGYDPGAIDGVLSDPTRQALRQFQANKGITVDGRMSTETLNALGVVLPR